MTTQPPDPPHPDDPTRTGLQKPATGQRSIGPFTIARKLGEGGMGIVYEAEQHNPHRAVALKVMRGGAFVDDAHIKMFQREAQTLARLKHPSIAAIYEMGRTEEGQHYFAMELVRGETLSDWMKRGRSGSTTAGPVSGSAERRIRLGLFCKVCDAVAYAHQRGVIHRDLKPSNILVMKESQSASTETMIGVPDVKVLDFGLARLTDPDVAMSTVVSELGSVRGTLPYMSPEQVRGNPDEIDLRTDVYSLGVILYELLTGQLPYDVARSQLPDAVRIICEEPPRSLAKSSSKTERISADIATVALKALEKEPARRYQTVAGLAEDVRRYLSDQPILARPPSAAYQLRKLVVRHKLAFGSIAALFVLLSAFAATMAIQASRIAKERDRANREAEASKRVSDFLVELFHVADPNEARGNTVTAREILDKGADKVQRELKDQPVIEGRLLVAMGRVYHGLGLYAKSETLLRRSVALIEQSFGKDSLEVADCLEALTMSLCNHGKFLEARDIARRAIEIKEQRLPADDVRLARSLYVGGLSTMQAVSTGSADAVRLLERARAIFETKLGPDAIEVGWCWNDLGVERVHAGDLPGALDRFRKALAVKERALPPDHPDLALGLNAIAFVLGRQGAYEEARGFVERAIAIQTKAFGEDHPELGDSIQTMSELCWRAGQPDQALPYAQRALAMREKAFAAGTPELAIDYVTLGGILRDLHRMGEAEVYFKKALDLARLGQGRTPVSVQDVATEYAKLLRFAGREAEARAMEAGVSQTR